MRAKRTVSIFLAATILAAGGFFAIPNTAHAIPYGGANPLTQWLVGTGLDILQAFVTGISYIINFLGGLAFAFGNMLTQTMLALNYQVLDSSNTIVTVGWGITRDVANLGFVLLIILVALATIVRYPSEYQAQKLLPRLIAAARLVNFSLAIVTPLIDFSDTLTQNFASRIGGDDVPGIPGSGFVGRISNAFGPHRLLIPPTGGLPEPVGFDTLSKAFLTAVGGLFFSFIFTWLAALVMLAIAFMLFLRYVHLTFLLAIAPLVWLFWVFPGLETHWKTWWSDFIKWVFFAPAVMFFIYLAVTAADAMGRMPVEGLTGSNFFETFVLSIISQGAQMAVLGAFLVGSLIVGQKFSIGGAGAALNIAKAAKTQGLKLAGQRAKLAGRWGAQQARKVTDTKAVQSTAKILGKGFEIKPTDSRVKKLFKGTANVLSGAGVKVKPTDNLLMKGLKGTLNAASGLVGVRAVTGGLGKAPKAITTAAGRDVKVDSLGGSMFKAVKGQFMKEAGFEQKEPEKTTDDYVKEVKGLVKQKKGLKDKGALTPESEKELDKKIEQAKGRVRNSLERPGTAEGWNNRAKRLQEFEDGFIKDPEIGTAGEGTFADMIKESTFEEERILEREQRKTAPTAEIEAAIKDLKEKRTKAIVEGDPKITVTEQDASGNTVQVDRKLTELFDKQIEAAEKVRRTLSDLDERLWKKDKPWEDQKLTGGLGALRTTIANLNTDFQNLNTNIAQANQAAELTGTRAIPTSPLFSDVTIDVVEADIENQQRAAAQRQQGGETQQAGGQQGAPRQTIYTAYNTPYTPPTP